MCFFHAKDVVEDIVVKDDGVFMHFVQGNYETDKGEYQVWSTIL